MENGDGQEEDILDGDISGSCERLQNNASQSDKLTPEKFKVGDDRSEIDDEITSSLASDSSKNDSGTTCLSRTEPVEIGSERLMMRKCPFFYIPDNTYKKKLTQVPSKIGSLENINHRAGGGDKKIFSRKINVSHITSRTNSKRNTYPTMLPVKDIRKSKTSSASRQDFKPDSSYNPVSGKVVQACSKIGSLKNINHIPRGGDKKVPTYRTPDYKHKISSKLDTTDPTPSVHQLKSDIDDLVCDEVIHYHSRYKHSRRPHSAPSNHSNHVSQEESLHHFPHSGSNTLNHISLEHDQNLHTEAHVTESSENTSGDK